MRARILTASVGVPVVLLVVYYGVETVAVFSAIAALIAGWEISELDRGPDDRRNLLLIVIPPAIVIASSIMIMANHSVTWWFLPSVTTVGIGLLLICWVFVVKRSISSINGLVYSVAATYVGLLLSHGPALRSLVGGFDWLLVALLVSFAADSSAYAVGRAIGRHKVAPTVSPAKTWEGIVGGVLGGIGVAVALVLLLDWHVSVFMAVVLGILVTLGSVLGDLLESALKRRAGVKNTGRLLPGHGGILDRLDSLAPCLAIVYWFAIANGV